MRSINFSIEDFNVMEETKLDRYVKAMNQAIDENIPNENVFDYVKNKIEPDYENC